MYKITVQQIMTLLQAFNSNLSSGYSWHFYKHLTQIYLQDIVECCLNVCQCGFMVVTC